MKHVISYENLRLFAYSNDKICRKPIRGLVLDFFGLGSINMYEGETAEGEHYAEKGVLYIVPYYDPWAWMNMRTVKFADELVDVLFEKYGLGENTSIVSSGGSMGGLGSIVYSRYAKRTPVSCIANCPVCDLPFHYTERPDLPRTLYSAFGDYDLETLEHAMETASPLHLVPELPDIYYYIFHCEADKSVDKRKHSDKFVAEMVKTHRITYFTVPDRGHCDLTDEMKAKYRECILEHI